MGLSVARLRPEQAVSGGTCLEWINHAHEEGKRACPGHKMKVVRKTISTATATFTDVYSLLTLLGLLLLSGKKAVSFIRN